jgi:hypothetical protein
VDLPHHVADGSVPGVKAAAVRKLLHELGIPPEQLPVSQTALSLSPSLCLPAPSVVASSQTSPVRPPCSGRDP